MAALASALLDLFTYLLSFINECTQKFETTEKSLIGHVGFDPRELFIPIRNIVLCVCRKCGGLIHIFLYDGECESVVQSADLHFPTIYVNGRV